MRHVIRAVVMLSVLHAAVVLPCVVAQESHPLHAPFFKKNLYPDNADAKAEIREAVAAAQKNHHRILLVFGANWCIDCHILDAGMNEARLIPVVAHNFEVVHVDIGKGEKNQDLVTKYEIPIERGVPAVAVLESDGRLLYSQKNGEFENARSMTQEDLLAFLNKWKPNAR